MASTRPRVSRGSCKDLTDEDETQPPSPTHALDSDDGRSSSSRQLELIPNVLWFEHNSVVRVVTKCIQSYYEGPYTCWSNADEHAKQQWWNQFKTRFKWQPDIETSVKDAFEKKAAIRLKDMVYKAMHSKERPKWMSEDVSKRLKKIRATPSFKKKSEQFSKNKLEGSKSGTKHRQGSVSTKELADRLYNATGELLTPAEWFLRTHQKSDKSFVDVRSEATWDKYQELKTKKEIEDGTQQDIDCFFEAVGGRSRKGTIYGLGSLADFFYERHRKSAQSSQVMPSSSIVLHLQEQLKATQEELKEQKKQSEEQRKQYEKGLADLKEEMEKMSQLYGCSDYSSFNSRDYRCDSPDADNAAVV